MDENVTKHIAVVVSEDEMSADLFLGMVDDPDVYNVDEIIEYLKETEHIVAGVKPSVIMDMINQRTYGKMVTVANGAPGVDGRDGFFNFQFDTSPSKKPKVLPDGTVDYHNLSLVQSVEIGDLLATYVPKCEGRDGYTVRGKVLPAKRCKDIPPLRGKGFTISTDGKKYYAACDGKVELSMGQLNVLQFHTINGDVDLSVGNIDFKGDLEILGSIKEGFSVKATGNITVNKLIEAADVEAGKDILVRGGILGGGKANISAGGNVYALFIENATVRANNSVQADAIVNCNVNAFSDINIFGKTSTIVGGKLKANRKIKTRKIGGEVGAATELTVGIEPDALATYTKMAKELEELTREIEKVEKTIELMQNKPKKDDNLMMQLIRTKVELNADLYKHRSICEELQKRIEIGKYAEIIAEDKVCPGVIINIDGHTLHVDEEYTEIVFLRKGDKILSKKLQKD